MRTCAKADRLLGRAAPTVEPSFAWSLPVTERSKAGGFWSKLFERGGAQPHLERARGIGGGGVGCVSVAVGGEEQA